jgi:hypothetical protein
MDGRNEDLSGGPEKPKSTAAELIGRATSIIFCDYFVRIRRRIMGLDLTHAEATQATTRRESLPQMAARCAGARVRWMRLMTEKRV